MNKLSSFPLHGRLLCYSRVLTRAYYTLFYLPAVGVGILPRHSVFWVLSLLLFLLERNPEGKGEGTISAAQRILSFITQDAV